MFITLNFIGNKIIHLFSIYPMIVRDNYTQMHAHKTLLWHIDHMCRVFILTYGGQKENHS